LAYFVKLLTFFSFCLFVGVLIKRSAFALGFLFISFVFEMILSGVFRYELFDAATSQSIMQFFPFTSMWNLINEPATRIVALHSPSDVVEITDYAVYWYELAIATGWIFTYIFLSYKLLKRRDL
jgi:hypothetical protein